MIEQTIQADKSILVPLYHQMSQTKDFSCAECGTSFSSHEGLVKHNIEAHGATIGEQLRQSEEIQRQRREE